MLVASASHRGAELTPKAPTQRRWRARARPHLDGAPISAEGALTSESSKSKSRSIRRKKNQGDTTVSLPDDIFFYILSRLPVKSLCRCKAVSRRWRSLICHEDYSRKFPQTLPCLLFCTSDRTRRPPKLDWHVLNDNDPDPPKLDWHVLNVWEGPTPLRPLVSPSLSFLPAGYTILDCCNGMLLCRFSESNSRDAFRYAVCNPVELTMIVLPDSGCGGSERVPVLAFDAAFYPEFHVLEFVMNVESDPHHDPNRDEIYVVGANIYSSVTGAWNYKESGWHPEAYVCTSSSHIFFNGFMHFPFSREILVVDLKGEKWCSIPCPYVKGCTSKFVSVYKGHLCYATRKLDLHVLSFWILEDYTKYDWTLKHQVRIHLLCEKQIGRFHKDSFSGLIGILPDCNFILYRADQTLMAYDMDREEVHAIQKLDCCHHPKPMLYVPLYTG